MKRCLVFITWCCVVMVAATGCGSGLNKNSEEAADKVVLPGDDHVLARVNGTSISEFDLEDALNRMLGEYQVSLLDENGRRKALDSLVTSRVIAQAAEKELDSDALAHIEKQVQAHHEKLLVNAYLKEYGEAEPVTHSMVQDYYDQHPERFGAKIIRRYEMLYRLEKTSPSTRDTLISALKEAASSNDWPTQQATLGKKGFAVLYRQGNSDDQMLHAQLRQLLASQKIGTVSDVTFISGNPYVIRMLSDEQVPPRPLAEVNAEIRQTLAPVQLKKSIKNVADKLRDKSVIEYVDDGGA